MRIPSSNLQNPSTARQFLNRMDLKVVASRLFQFKPFRDQISKQFPAFSAGIGKEAFVTNFLRAIEDPAFQIIAVTAIQNMMGLGLLPTDIYKTEQIQQALQSEYISTGKYQKTTGTLPPREVLPTMTLDQLMKMIERGAVDPNLKLPAEKLKFLRDMIQRGQQAAANFDVWTQKNMPFVRKLV